MKRASSKTLRSVALAVQGGAFIALGCSGGTAAFTPIPDGAPTSSSTSAAATPDGGPDTTDEASVAAGDAGTDPPSPNLSLPFLVSPTAPGPGNAHTSPAIVATTAGNLVAAFDDTDEDTTHHALGWSRSTSYGAAFTDEGHFPDPLPGGVDDRYGSAAMARDGQLGRIYVAGLGASETTSNGIALFVSPDDGVTFNPGIEVADPNLSPSDYVDYPAIAVDSRPGYAEGTVFVAYSDFVDQGTLAVRLRLSTYANGTVSVTEVVNTTLGSGDEASMPSVAVAANDDVLLAYYACSGGAPSIAFIRSQDGGNHFGAPVQVAALHVPTTARGGNLGLSGTTPSGVPAPFDAHPSPVLAVNPVTGALYVAYVDATENDKADVYFVQSGDEGQSWTMPVRVNDDRTTNDQFLPAIGVSPDGARLVVDFYDRRDDAANTLANRYRAAADVSGPTAVFAANDRISPAPFPILVATPGLSPAYFSRSSSVVTDGTYFYDAYTDTSDGHLDVRVVRFGVGP